MCKSMGRRGRVLLSAAAVVLAVAGGSAIVAGVAAQQGPPPQPSAAEATPTTTPTSTPTSSSPTAGHATPTTPPAPPHLDKSRPVHLSVPSIGVDTSLITLGLNKDGSIQVPDVRKAKDSKAGWYKYSPTPGQIGPSVIIGHVSSEYKGPAVFYKLGDIKRGDQATVTRADGKEATFVVTKVVEVKKATFPTNKIYGNTDDAELRLITCGGEFNESTGHHLDNIVVYAKYKK